MIRTEYKFQELTSKVIKQQKNTNFNNQANHNNQKNHKNHSSDSVRTGIPPVQTRSQCVQTWSVRVRQLLNR